MHAFQRLYGYDRPVSGYISSITRGKTVYLLREELDSHTKHPGRTGCCRAVALLPRPACEWASGMRESSDAPASQPGKAIEHVPCNPLNCTHELVGRTCSYNESIMYSEHSGKTLIMEFSAFRSVLAESLVSLGGLVNN